MKNVRSQKIWLLGALLLPLTACNVGTTGSIPVPTDFNVGVDVGDSTSSVTVTKTVTAATNTAPAKTTWAVGNVGLATFAFTSRPGSDAGYVTHFRILSDIINGTETVTTPIDSTLKLNIYVPSGYTCDVINPADPTKPRSQTHSCDPVAPTSVQGNGATSIPLSLDFAGPLASTVVATNSSASRVTQVEFLGFTTRSKTFSIVTTVISAGIKSGDE